MKKKGLIIIISFLLFILAGFSVYKYEHKPQMTIIVKYRDVPPIIKGFLRGDITVYYRGYKVGKVSKFALSGDQQSVLFYLEIYYKNLKLPKNIGMILKTEDIYGARYFSISYPKNPSPQLLSNGDVIKGTATYERLDKYLVAQFETGKLKILVDNLIDLTNFMDIALKSNKNEFLNEFKKSGGNIGSILSNLKELIEDPQVKNDIKSTLKYSSRSIKNLDQIMETNRESIRQIVSKAPESIDKTIANLESINKNMPEVNNNILKADNTIQKTSRIIKKTNSSISVTNCNLDTINRKVPEIPPDLLPKADKALTKFDCMGTELIDLLNERFLIFKFLFGKPGSSFERCKLPTPDCLCAPEKSGK
jgi:ABC-type transporter Mla subunit MlaD